MRPSAPKRSNSRHRHSRRRVAIRRRLTMRFTARTHLTGAMPDSTPPSMSRSRGSGNNREQAIDLPALERKRERFIMSLQFAIH